MTFTLVPLQGSFESLRKMDHLLKFLRRHASRKVEKPESILKAISDCPKKQHETGAKLLPDVDVMDRLR